MVQGSNPGMRKNYSSNGRKDFSHAWIRTQDHRFIVSALNQLSYTSIDRFLQVIGPAEQYSRVASTCSVVYYHFNHSTLDS